ncbi:hypothetical protein [Allopusillimonas ginsengisoli]|uniref:hypothetical protein n=1 Tax=Allopusillimonas ginsengisoli TaxID=453575 RepID=UPI00101F3126|nr:hypothetical protein [Allopusillimonas ginsengisoli]TEA78517.1 hypothetical protein ERE07_08890 [Allopusillimonas ginsengisoli]
MSGGFRLGPRLVHPAASAARGPAMPGDATAQGTARAAPVSPYRRPRAQFARAIPRYRWEIRHTRLLAFLRMLGRKPFPFAGILSLHESGFWELDPGQRGVLRLAHAWLAPAWVTLRFQRADPDAPAAHCDLSIWKSSLSGPDWRQLRLQVARQAAMPERALNKEKA